MKESKDIQEPQNHANNHNGVQNRLEGRCHGDEAIHQPQQYTHHDQDFQYLNRGMIFDPPLDCRWTT